MCRLDTDVIRRDLEWEGALGRECGFRAVERSLASARDSVTMSIVWTWHQK